MAATKLQRDGSTATAVEKPSPLYRSPKGEGEADQLEQFYTSTNELPPQLEECASDAEDATVVHDQYHPSQADVAALENSTPIESGRMKHGKHGDATSLLLL